MYYVISIYRLEVLFLLLEVDVDVGIGGLFLKLVIFLGSFLRL